MATLRILLADDHAAVRRSLRAVVEAHPGWTLCAEVSNGREAVERTLELRPDVVLLDMTMPELNGLEATRAIVNGAPGTSVLLLTTHESKELVDEARRAGAEGVVLKSESIDTLTKAVESSVAIHLGRQTVVKAHHIGAFFRSKAEEVEMLTPFVEEGIRRGEKAIHVVDPGKREEHLQGLREAGIDVDNTTTRGQLILASWNDLYLRDGHFDMHAMLATARDILDEREAQGFSIGRIIAHMGWALEQRPGVGDLAEYEAHAQTLLSQRDDIVICVYDLSIFPASTIIDVMRSHPALLIGRTLHDNAFFTPPETLIDELHHRS